MKVTSPLAGFVPASIVRRYGESALPPQQPEVETVAAAVLFADISGFTPLAERMAQIGPRGAEKLTARLNEYFGRLIEVVSAHGGEVVGFAGDALLALWSEDRAGKEEARAGKEEAGAGKEEAGAGKEEAGAGKEEAGAGKNPVEAGRA